MLVTAAAEELLEGIKLENIKDESDKLADGGSKRVSKIVTIGTHQGRLVIISGFIANAW